MSYWLLLWASVLAAPAAGMDTLAGPPQGTYLCYFYGYNYDLTSSSLTQVRVLPKNQIEIVGEVVPFAFEAKTSLLTLKSGAFKGATAHYRLDSSRKPTLVFKRAENEKRGHKIDVSDTWCYLES